MLNRFICFFLILTTSSGNLLYSQYAFKTEIKIPASLASKSLLLKWRNIDYKFEKGQRVTGTIKGGKCLFSGELNAPSVFAQLEISGTSQSLYFLLDSGNTTAIIHQVNQARYKIVINDSKSNTALGHIDNMGDSMNKIHSSNLTYENRIKEIEKFRQHELIYLSANPDLYYSIMRLYQLSYLIETISPHQILNCYYSLNKDLQNSELGKKLYKEVQVSLSLDVNNRLPDFIFFNPDGTAFTKTSLKEKSYLIAFGATWCGPCKKMIPELKELNDRYKNRGFELIYINMDSDNQKWAEMMKEKNLNNWINVTDKYKFADSPMASVFNLKSIPFYLIIDKTHTIRYNSFLLKDFTYEGMESYIKQSLP